VVALEPRRPVRGHASTVVIGSAILRSCHTGAGGAR
jgi:hypothetical protein